MRENNSKTDVLKTIEDENSKTTNSIQNVWSMGSFFAIIGIGYSSFKDGNFSALSIVIGAIIIVLSINSINFYKKIIVKIRDSKIGNRLSVFLVYSYLFLLLAVIIKPFLTWLAIGILIITIKSTHLYFYSKKKDFGNIIVRYFRNIALAYLIFSVFAIFISIYYDMGKLSSLFDDPYNSSYKNINLELVILENKGINTEIIKENIRTLYDNALYKNRLNQYSYGLLLVFTILSLLYFIVRMYKRMNYNDLYDELKNFYADKI